MMYHPRAHGPFRHSIHRDRDAIRGDPADEDRIAAELRAAELEEALSNSFASRPGPPLQGGLRRWLWRVLGEVLRPRPQPR